MDYALLTGAFEMGDPLCLLNPSYFLLVIVYRLTSAGLRQHPPFHVQGERWSAVLSHIPIWYHEMPKPSFEWDERKNLLNQKKHRVSFEEAQKAFDDPKRIIIRDLDHEQGEKRFFCLGLVERDVLTVRFSYRRKRVRIYGVGYWRQGRKRYEQENQLHQ
ncbi:MAG TPA: BrnT family toxin [Nitrospira sp.]|nr:BrnT family toxin [Nitrospira sp.]